MYCHYENSCIDSVPHHPIFCKLRVSGHQGFSCERKINNPDASVGVCCSHKVVAVGFNTLCYDASVGVLNPRIIKS